MDYKGLNYERDIRRDPDEDEHKHRLGAFKGGWTRAVREERYDGVLEKLTWHNLGWRMGMLFGEADDERKTALFEWCVEHFHKTRATSRSTSLR